MDGAWQIVFDGNNEGGAKQWVREEHLPREQMQEMAVPSCWELVEKDYEGVACYRRAFKVPANWAGKTIRLHFDAVNFRSEFWLNDTAIAPLGKGRCLASQLRLLDNLGKDPVADKILFNLIHFIASSTP